jgi:hypothetical protein
VIAFSATGLPAQTYNQSSVVPVARADSLELGPGKTWKHSSHATDQRASQNITSAKFAVRPRLFTVSGSGFDF